MADLKKQQVQHQNEAEKSQVSLAFLKLFNRTRQSR